MLWAYAKVRISMEQVERRLIVIRTGRFYSPWICSGCECFKLGLCYTSPLLQLVKKSNRPPIPVSPRVVNNSLAKNNGTPSLFQQDNTSTEPLREDASQMSPRHDELRRFRGLRQSSPLPTHELEPAHRYCSSDGLVKPFRTHHCQSCATVRFP